MKFSKYNPIVMRAIFTLLALCALCVVSCKTQRPAAKRIEEPKFSITAIKILQDNLVNTRLKVTLCVENPNAFPVELSSFEYELYGEGRFWADGTERNVLAVPAANRADKDLILVMNFIDMKRDLLDKVIAMDRVKYRFAGTVQINAADMPLLLKNFNLEGESEVER